MFNGKPLEPSSRRSGSRRDDDRHPSEKLAQESGLGGSSAKAVTAAATATSAAKADLIDELSADGRAGQHRRLVSEDKKLSPSCCAAEQPEVGGPTTACLICPAGEGQGSIKCCLTAKTSDNQCALHGSGPASTKVSNERNKGDQLERLKNSSKQLENNKSQRFLKRRKAAAAAADRAASIPSWPLGRKILNHSNFGDCEHIFSPHLNGHLYEVKKVCPAGNGAGSNKQIKEEARSPLNSAGNCPPPEGEFVNGIDIENCNNNNNSNNNNNNNNSSYNNNARKRPFGQSLERPTTGWLYNATGPEKVNQIEGLKGKLTSDSG